MNTFEITRRSVATNNYGFRKARKTTKVFLDTNLSDPIDQFFKDNKIWNLDFKSKTCGKAKRKVNSYVNQVLREHFKNELGVDKVKISFSHNCGCSCGCSPGYNVRAEYLVGEDVFGKIQFDQTTINEIKSYVDQLQPELEQEILQHNG